MDGFENGEDGQLSPLVGGSDSQKFQQTAQKSNLPKLNSLSLSLSLYQSVPLCSVRVQHLSLLPDILMISMQNVLQSPSRWEVMLFVIQLLGSFLSESADICHRTHFLMEIVVF